MSDELLMDEDSEMLDEYLDTIGELSSSPNPDYAKRNTVYSACAKAYVERVQYVRRLDPSKPEEVLNQVKSVTYTLSMLIAALAHKPEGSDMEEQTMNINFFLEKIYKELGDPLTFSFVVVNGIAMLMKLAGDLAVNGQEVSMEKMVEIVTKARESGDLKVYGVDKDGNKHEFTDEELDELLGDWAVDNDVTLQ